MLYKVNGGKIYEYNNNTNIEIKSSFEKYLKKCHESPIQSSILVI